MTAPEPPPPVVETRFVGRLEFEGGFPTEATLQRLYDQLDFQRGCQVFLRHMMAAAIWGFQQAFTRDLGMGPTDIADPPRGRRGLALTGNSETVYGVAILDTKPRPDRAGGAAARARVPERPVDATDGRPGHRRARPGPRAGATCSCRRATRATCPAEASWRRCACAPTASGSCCAPSWGRAATRRPAMATLRGTQDRALVRRRTNPPPTRHIDGTGLSFDTIHPTDIRYFEDLAAMVEYEPNDAISAR